MAQMKKTKVISLLVCQLDLATRTLNFVLLDRLGKASQVTKFKLHTVHESKLRKYHISRIRNL